MAHPLTARRDKFAQLVAAGATYTDAYVEAYAYAGDRKTAREEGSRLMAITDVVLRVQELRRPIMRKAEKAFKYTLNQALEQCNEMYQIAYSKADPAAMGKAIELQSKLVKILSDQVEHRHGILSDVATDVLLKMRQALEDRQSPAIRLIEGPTPVSEEVPS